MLLALILFILIPANGWSQIVAWQFGIPASTGSEVTYNATTNDTHLNTSVLSRGSGIIACSSARGFVAYSWTSANKTLAVSGNDYFEFSIQASLGYRVSLSTLDATIFSRKSGNYYGPIVYNWKYSIDGGTTFTDIGSDLGITTSSSTTGVAQAQINLSSIADLQNITFASSIKLRLYAWGGYSGSSSYYFGFGTTPASTTTNCLAIGGIVEQLTVSTSASSLTVAKTINSVITTAVSSNTTWTASSDQNWLTVNSGSTGNGTLSCTATSTNTEITPRTATVTLKASGVTDKTVTVTQEAGDATLSVSAATANVTKAINSTASVDVSSNSTWTASSDQSWLSVTSGATGNGTLTMTTTAANPTIETRTATITLKATGTTDKTITVTQAVGDATLSVSAATANVTKAINSTATIDVTSNSTWSAISDQNWLSVTSGATGNATLTMTTTAANPTIVTRSAIVTLKATGAADKTITVTQAVGDPTLSVSANTANVAKTVNSIATVDVTSNSTWTATSDQSWLTVNSGATGNGTLTCTVVSTNPTITTRTATVTLKATGATDKTVTVTQAIGDATLTVSAATANVTKAINSTATIDVFSNSTWTATSDQNWLSVTSGDTGNATLTMTTTAENPTIATRSAIVTLKATGAADKTITVTQAIGDPTLSVSTNTANVAKTVNSIATVDVTSNSKWTATSDQSWLTVNSGATGNATLTMTTTAANPTIATRTAIVTLKATGAADKTVIITQAVGDPTLSVSALNVTIAKTVNTLGSVNILSNTTWTTVSNQSWLQVAPGEIGNSKLYFKTLTANPMAFTRQAQITLKANGTSDVIFNIMQDAADPTLSISTNTVDISKSANSTANLSVSSNTSWVASSDKSWLSVTQGATGNATLAMTVNEINPTISTRTATVTVRATGVSDKIITVIQAVGDASLSVSSTTANLSKQANSTATVNVISNSSWTATSNQNWLTVGNGATGNGTLSLQATANNLSEARVGIITLKAQGASDKTITVTQEAGDPTLSTVESSIIISKTDGSTGNVTIISNTYWTATSDQNWLNVTAGTYGIGSIILTAAKNPTISSRKAIVTVKATGVSDKIVSITQEAGDPVLSVSENSVLISQETFNSIKLNISTNTSWKVTSNRSWINLTPDTTGTLIISASGTTVSRIGIVTISAPDITDTKITVIQSASSNSNDYQLNMTVTSIVAIDSVEVANGNLQISAYIGNECRGTSVLKYLDSNNKYMAYLMIWGNASDVNKTIIFKCVNPTDTTSYITTDQSLKFIPNAITGSLANPYKINVQQEAVNIAGVIPVNVSSLTGLTTGSVIAVNAGAILNLDKNISSKKITVNPGGKLTLKNGVKLNTQTLVLQSDPNGTTESATFVDNNPLATQSVNATVQQYLSSGRNWYISSPVSAATSEVFAASPTHPLYWYDESKGSSAPWAQINNSSTTLVPLRGYVANLATSGIVSFSGTLNSGTQSISVYRTAGQIKEGFNLVGNPYPSYLDWESALKTNLLNTVWYRTKNSNAYVFDTFNANGGIGTNNNGKGAVTKHIPPLQAFWVRVGAGKSSGTLTVDNTMRSHSQGNNPFKSPALQNPGQAILRLQISNGINSDETIVYFNSEASDEYDSFDSPKMSNSNTAIPEIYTLAGNEQMCINGFNSIKYDKELALGIITEKSENLTLHALEITNFGTDTKIILKDNLLNTTQELISGLAYKFSSALTNSSSRFSLIFKSTGNTTDLNQNPIKPLIAVFANINGQIVVNLDGNIAEKTKICIYNSVGMIVYNAELQSSTTVSQKRFSSGVYFIKINYNNFDYYQKIIL